MKYSKKVVQLLAFSGWTQDRLADLMGVSNNTVSAWVRGEKEPRETHAESIDWMYSELVEPYVCELEVKADKLAEKMLKEQIAGLADDNVCDVK